MSANRVYTLARGHDTDVLDVSTAERGHDLYATFLSAVRLPRTEPKQQGELL